MSLKIYASFTKGFKKCFIIGMAKEVPETHANLKIFLNENGIKSLCCLFSMDFKALREALGMQSCAAKFPCAYCHATSPFDAPATMRSFKSLKENYQAYKELVGSLTPLENYTL